MDPQRRSTRVRRHPFGIGDWSQLASVSVSSRSGGNMPWFAGPVCAWFARFAHAQGRLAHGGIQLVTLTLHTGVASLEGHEKPYAEEFRVPESTARAVRQAKADGRRVIAVGTTVVRALESAAIEGDGEVIATHAWTDLVISPE